MGKKILSAQTKFENFKTGLSCVPEHLHPRQMLFLSADIVGSTALKQSAGIVDSDRVGLPDGELWFSLIQGFYIKTVKDFLPRFNRKKNAAVSYIAKQKYGSEPILWKTIGDEILFRKIVEDHSQVKSTLECWIETISEIRKFLKAKNRKLDVKCTAWLAEFPLQNKMVVGPTTPNFSNFDPDNLEGVGDFIGKYEKERKKYPGTHIDFIGPAIDIGFRLATLSTSRKFVISLDVARCLAESNSSKIKIFYDGRIYLKGVIGGIEYPVFWICMSNSTELDHHEDRLISKRPCPSSSIKEFCSSFYEDESNPSYAPFIITDSDTDMRAPPDKYYDPYWVVANRYTSDNLVLCQV